MAVNAEPDHRDDYEIRHVGRFVVIHVRADVHSQVDFSWLRNLISELCVQGKPQIALEFDKKSYLYSKLIAVLIAGSGIVKQYRGVLALVDPGKYVLNALETMKLRGSIVAVYRSEHDLAAGTPL